MVPDPSGIVADLTLLLTSPTLTDRERAAGQRLLRRLTVPVRVALHGPDQPLAQAISQAVADFCQPDLGAVEVAFGGRLEDADIVLWCTQAFVRAEQEAWGAAPDALKDHSFLVACAPRPADLPHLECVAEEEFIAFHHLPGVEETVELQAMRADLKRQIEGGVQAVQDSAHLFVQRLSAKMPAGDVPAEAVVEGVLARVAPAEADPVNVAPIESDPRGADPVFEAALAQLTAHEAALQALAEGDPADLCQSVFELCSAASDELVEVLAAAPSDHPDYAPMCDVLYEAADNIMLMSLENNLNSAADAVTVLLQVRKDLCVCMAA